jgi:predicted ATPase
MKTPMLQSFRLENFKAVRDSGTVKFGPLTAFIGNNGSGKSSLIEGLETLHSIVTEGVDKAMQQWRGIEHIWHQGLSRQLRMSKDGVAYHVNPMRFYLRGRAGENLTPFTSSTEVTLRPGGNELLIYQERVSFTRGPKYERDPTGKITAQPTRSTKPGEEVSGPAFRAQLDDRGYFRQAEPLSNDNSLLEQVQTTAKFISAWQFLTLIPQNMGAPIPQSRTGGTIRLAKDGSNIAQYLLDIRTKDSNAFDGIVETLQYVLPYTRDLQPSLTSELERTVYLQLTEADFKVPGWLLSTGTLRLLCLLALLRHPDPPPLIVIEEIENGLDPRTVNLVVDEIRDAVEAGRTQLILTTHSPYLLDLLTLSHIVLVERVDGKPTFTRPADRESLHEWAKEFAPGQLYTMDLLSRKDGK